MGSKNTRFLRTFKNKKTIPLSMELILSKKPKGVTIVEGFPGFGLIGTIATEFLIEHLETLCQYRTNLILTQGLN